MNVTINGVKLNDAQTITLYMAVVNADRLGSVGSLYPELQDAYLLRVRELLDLMERQEHAATC